MVKYLGQATQSEQSIIGLIMPLSSRNVLPNVRNNNFFVCNARQEDPIRSLNHMTIHQIDFSLQETFLQYLLFGICIAVLETVFIHVNISLYIDLSKCNKIVNYNRKHMTMC